jgi:hypothetical protein
MANRIPPLKNDPVEGFEEDFDPNADAIDVRGVHVQNDTSNDATTLLSRDASNNMTFTDSVAGSYTLAQLAAGGSGLTPTQHENLDTLTHGLVDTGYDVVTYTANKITNLTTWTDNTLVTKVREQQISYIGNKVSQTIEIQYDASGVEVYRIQEDYTYTGNNFANVTRTRI